MAQMVRKQVYIEPVQEKIVKQQAMMLGITEAEVIRRAIDRQTDLIPIHIWDLEAWEREKAFITSRMPCASVPSGHRFRREEIYEERLNRYGR